MTRAMLRSKCLLGIRDLSPEAFIPDVNAKVLECSRGFARAIGGIPKTTTITTAVDQQEYGTNDGFPSDFMSHKGATKTVSGTVIDLGLISRGERNDISGEPMDFYVEKKAKIIGFDFIPDSIMDIEFYYLGLGSTPTLDTSDMLAELNVPDEDPAWNAIAHRFAAEYYRARTADAVQKENIKGISIYEREVEKHEKDMRAIEFDYSIAADQTNQAAIRGSKLPAGYFSSGGELNHGRLI